MFRRIFIAAIAAGCISGLLLSLLQVFTTTPIILHAEQYEDAGPRAGVGASLILAHAGHADSTASAGARTWAPSDGLERTAFTTLANLVVGVGYAMLLVACFALHGGQVDGRRGLLWGLAGFAVFTLAPGLGLPPEVPGAYTAELIARQGWWLFAAAAAALGLWLMVFGRRVAMIALGILVIALPHLIGAPHPADLGGSVPPELAGQFAATSIVISAVFWAMLGWFSGTIYRRLPS